MRKISLGFGTVQGGTSPLCSGRWVYSLPKNSQKIPQNEMRKTSVFCFPPGAGWPSQRHWKGWRLFPCSGRFAMGSLSHGQGFARDSSGCATAAPGIGFWNWIVYQCEQGTRARREEVTFVIVSFPDEPGRSAHSGVWKYMAKSLFLLILSWFERCKIPRVEKHWDLHLETKTKNQIRFVPAGKKHQYNTRALGAVGVSPDWNAVGSSSPVKCTAWILHG